MPTVNERQGRSVTTDRLNMLITGVVTGLHGQVPGEDFAQCVNEAYRLATVEANMEVRARTLLTILPFLGAADQGAVARDLSRLLSAVPSVSAKFIFAARALNLPRLSKDGRLQAFTAALEAVAACQRMPAAQRAMVTTLQRIVEHIEYDEAYTAVLARACRIVQYGSWPAVS